VAHSPAEIFVRDAEILDHERRHRPSIMLHWLAAAIRSATIVEYCR